jgi:uncharacterized protein (DUF2252 family)
MATATKLEASPRERAVAGKAVRSEIPRSSHAEWVVAGDRPDPIGILEGQAKTRLPELIPIRYGRMLASPFAYFRGAAAVMASDLGATQPCGLHAQLCGDAHLSNFGVFASPERRLVFSVNDFDETLSGPFEWDVKRLAASVDIAGRERGFTASERLATVLATVRSYRRAMRRFAKMRDLDVWYARLDVERLGQRLRQGATKAQVKIFERTIEKARHKDSMQAMRKLTYRDNGRPRITSSPPMIIPVEEVVGGVMSADEEVEQLLDAYRQSLANDRRHLAAGYRYAHAARKVVGVGSVGTRAWIALLTGRDHDDPLFLQFKQAQPSVLEPFADESPFSHHGRRVVEGQRLMQAASDIFLGWFTAELPGGERVDFYARQLWDWKASADLEALAPFGMGFYGELCGWTLARAHARSGDRIEIAAYLGKSDTFDRALADFAEAYADQNERDYAALEAAERTGRIEAQRGV